MTIEFLNPEEAPAPAASYSNLAILPPGKRILVIAGQIGNLIDGSMVEGLEAQYEQTLKNIHALVTSQGGSKHDIARITVFLTEEPSDWPKIPHGEKLLFASVTSVLLYRYKQKNEALGPEKQENKDFIFSLIR